MSDSRSIRELADRYYLPVYAPRQAVLERGEGSRVWDREGREYVDLAAGIAVTALGHANPQLRQALMQQADKLWHTSNVFVSEPPLRLAQALVEHSGFASRAFLCSSGAEANEAAIKLARRYASSQGRDESHRTILTFDNSFHGRTMATVTAGGQPKYRATFEPLPGGFDYLPFNDLAAVRARMARGDVCAILVEPVQGEGGVTPATPEFLRGLRDLCDNTRALLMFDEVQCGMGRTGTLFAWEQSGVKPDVVTLAKALGAGIPIGAMLCTEQAANCMAVGAHGSTFGGNPLASAVALKALEMLADPSLLANVTRQSNALVDGLQAINARIGCFTEIRGQGLMLGAQLSPAWSGRASEILDACMEKGLLALQAGPDVLRFVPALNIGDADIAEGLTRLDSALRALQ